MENKDHSYDEAYAPPEEMTDCVPLTDAAPYPMNYRTDREDTVGKTIVCRNCGQTAPAYAPCCPRCGERLFGSGTFEPEPLDVYAGPPVPDIGADASGPLGVYAGPPVSGVGKPVPEPKTVYAAPRPADAADAVPRPRSVYGGPRVPDKKNAPRPVCVYMGPPVREPDPKPVQQSEDPVQKPEQKKKGFFGKLFGKERS